jgi:hypothetical protein
MTKAQKIAEYDHVAAERDRFMLALNDMLNQDVEWSGWHKEHDSQGRYRVGLSRMDSASGGLVTLIYRHPNQRDYVTTWDACGFDQGMSNTWYANPALRDAYHDAMNVWHDARVVPPIASAFIPAAV